MDDLYLLNHAIGWFLIGGAAVIFVTAFRTNRRGRRE